MKKIFRWYVLSKKEKEEIDSQDKQLNTALKKISKLEKDVEFAKNELKKEIELKDKYLNSYKEIKLKLNKFKKELSNKK